MKIFAQHFFDSNIPDVLDLISTLFYKIIANGSLKLEGSGILGKIFKQCEDDYNAFISNYEVRHICNKIYIILIKYVLGIVE